MSNEEIKGADTFAQVVERYRTMWADWELVDTPGDHPTHAILRKGLVQVHEQVIEQVRTFGVTQLGLRWCGIIPSPLLGPVHPHQHAHGL